MNKKGFTLVEILSVLVLIGLLLGLAIPGINKISSNMKKKSYNKKISLVESAAELWGQDNRTLLQSSNDCKLSDKEIVSCYKIKIKDLISDNYLDSDNNSGNYINPINNSDMNNDCVYVYKQNNRVYSKHVNDEKCENKPSIEPDPFIEPTVEVTPDETNMSKFNITITPGGKNKISKIQIKSYFVNPSSYTDNKYNYTNFNDYYTINGNKNSYTDITLNNKTFSIDLLDLLKKCYEDSGGQNQCLYAVNPDFTKFFNYIYGYKIKIDIKSKTEGDKTYYYEINTNLNSSIKSLNNYTYKDNRTSYIKENNYAINSNGDIVYLVIPSGGTHENSFNIYRASDGNINTIKNNIYSVPTNCSLNYYQFKIYNFTSSTVHFNYDYDYYCSGRRYGDSLIYYYNISTKSLTSTTTSSSNSILGTVSNELNSKFKSIDNTGSFLKYYIDNIKPLSSSMNSPRCEYQINSLFSLNGNESNKYYIELTNKDNLMYVKSYDCNNGYKLFVIRFKKSLNILSKKFVDN